MQKTVFKAKESYLYKCLYRLHPLPRAWFPFATLLSTIWYDNEYDGPKARARHLEHYQHIRQVVPKENLLEMELGDGWEPLCQFLGVPVPDVPYPHSNDSKVFQNRHRLGKSLLVQLVVGIILMAFIAATVPMQAQDIYRRDPELFLSYVRLCKSWMRSLTFCDLADSFPNSGHDISGSTPLRDWDE
jgi:hypothetical protein